MASETFDVRYDLPSVASVTSIDEKFDTLERAMDINKANFADCVEEKQLTDEVSISGVNVLSGTVIATFPSELLSDLSTCPGVVSITPGVGMELID